MQNQRGAMWLEVLVIVAVAGIIAVIAIPSLRQARETEVQRTDFQKYFGVNLPAKLNDDQRAVLRPFVKKRLTELSATSDSDYAAMTKMFQLPPAENATEVQSRLDAITKASVASKNSMEDLRRAKAAAQLRGLAPE